jgi:hypothetical protein
LIVVASIVTSNQYHFVTRWRVEATCGEVADILGDPLSFPRWWPSVYLDVRETAPPGPDGLGRRIALVTKGWLPYTIRWEFVVVESRYPYGLAIAAAASSTAAACGSLRKTAASSTLPRLAAARGEAAARAVLSAETAVREPPVAMAQASSLRLELLRRARGGVARGSRRPPGPSLFRLAVPRRCGAGRRRGRLPDRAREGGGARRLKRMPAFRATK